MAQFHPDPSNPAVVKFIDYFVSADLKRKDSDVMADYPAKETGIRELERKRRIGEVTATLYGFYDDIKHLMVSNVKIIPAPDPSTSAKWHFKSCSPISLCILVRHELAPGSAVSSPKRDVSHSPIRFNATPNITSIFVNFNLGASYPGATQPQSDTSVEISHAIGICDGKVALLKRVIREYVRANLGQELIYGVIWEVKHYLSLLVTIPEDHNILSVPESVGFEMLLQLSGLDRTGPSSGGLYAALQLKQQKVQTEANKGKKKDREDYESDNAAPNSQTIRRAPIKLGDLISGKVLTDERGRALLHTLTTLSFTRRGTAHHNDDLPNYLTLALTFPRAQTFRYTMAKYKFILHRTDYVAYHSDSGRRFRVSTFKYDLSPIVRSDGQFWPTLAKHIEARLETFFSDEAISRFIKLTSGTSSVAEQLSTYEHFALTFNGAVADQSDDGPKHDLSLITFTLVREGFPLEEDLSSTVSSDSASLSTDSKYVNSLASLKRTNALCSSMRLGMDRKQMYTSKLLTALFHLQKSHYFQGEFLPEKIYFAQDGSVKIFDSYLDTLVQVLIPFVFENEVEVTKTGALKISELANLGDLLVKSMCSNDVFNFGSFVLALVTDFHFDPIMTVATGNLDLNINRLSQMLLRRLEAQVTKESLRDFIELCINPDEYQRVDFRMLLHHSFVLEWNARMVREIASQPVNNANPDEEEPDHNRYAMALLANDQGSTPEHDSQNDNATAETNGMFKELQGQTRSNLDFRPMICYGKGGFGHVYKVRNKLDDSYYALKRVYIKEEEMEKLRREVQHLSRLAHQNVVRYFAAWTEWYNGEWQYLVKEHHSGSNMTTLDESSFSEEATESAMSEEHTVRDDSNPAFKEDSEVDDSLVCFGDPTKPADQQEQSGYDTSSEASDTEDDDSSRTSEESSRHSDSSVNQSNGAAGQQVATSPAHTNKSRPSPPKSRKSPEKVSTFPCYCLCIQMELCEKQTLHDMIATQTIHKDPELKIRISAEILAGLDYIHKQGIIHRDLKPRNIFFDKNNRVKIGDFGLALAVSKTDSNESLSQESTLKSANESYSQLEMLRSGSISSLKTSPTDRGSRHSVGIGTLPYMAPEIYYDAHYTNLVDMFSFGVILFEMAYPMNTQSERIRVLEQLKPKKSSTMVAAVYKDSLVGFKPSLPTDVDKYIKPNEKKLIERLLDVLPANRPSASTLLKSGEFGPAGPAKKTNTAGIETKSPRNDIYESQKQLLQSAIKNPSPQQAFLLECLFARTQPMLESIAYDIDVSSESTDEFYNSIYQFNLVSRWFEAQSRQYGALHLQSVPFLMPKTSLYQSANVSTESCQLLDSEGMLVTLPYNLRTQLARYLALSGNSINFLCRSTMDRVFRREHAGPYHPRELWTASFDLIWPQEYSRATVVPYADLLCFTTQILSFFLPLSTESTPSVMGSNTSSTFANANTLVFHITNIPIFQAICDYLKINRQDYQLIIRLLAENMEAIVRNGFTPFRPILKMQLVKQAESEASFESLCELLTISSSTPTDLVAQIRAILCKSHKTQSVNGFLRNKVDQHITEMSTLHRLWGATQYPIPSSAIAFRFGLSCVSKTSFFYNHILIHAILEGQRLNVVAIGGRYDMMINGYKTLYQQAEEDVSMNEKCKSTGDTLPVMMSELWPSAKQDDDGLSRKEPTAATYQPRPFQPKFALGISFSVEKLCHFFGQSTESQLPGTCDFQAKFAKLFPFAQSPLGDVSPSLIDLIIAPSAPVPAVCRLAQLFRSRGLRLTILPELGAKELAEPMISKMEETDATIEMINSYAANVQVKLVLVIDQTELAKPRFGSSETHYTVREFSYAMTSDGKCLSVPEVMAPSQYLLGKGRWNKHYFATTEENAVNYVLGCTRRHERARNPSGVDSSANSSFTNGSPPDMFGNLPESLQLKSGFAGESSGVGRTMRSCSFSVGSAGGGGGGGGNQTAHITSPSSFHYPLMSTGSAPSSGFTSSSSGSSSAIDLDFISANKRSDRQRMTNSINNFFNKTLPALNTSLVRVLAVDLPFSVIKAVADIVESDLVADFMVPGGIPQPDSVFSFGGCGYDNSTLESFKGKFISLFNDLKARNKRDFADNIDKLAEELWRSIRKKLLTQEQNVGHTGAGQRSQPTVSMIVLIAYRDSQFKHRLVSL